MCTTCYFFSDTVWVQSVRDEIVLFQFLSEAPDRTSTSFCKPAVFLPLAFLFFFFFLKLSQWFFCVFHHHLDTHYYSWISVLLYILNAHFSGFAYTIDVIWFAEVTLMIFLTVVFFRTMSALSDNSALMTSNAWREDCCTRMARTWTPHTWTDAAQPHVLCHGCDSAEVFWECETYTLQYLLFSEGASWAGADCTDCFRSHGAFLSTTEESDNRIFF